MSVYVVKKLHVAEQLPVADHPVWLAVMMAEVIVPGSPNGTLMLPLSEEEYIALRDVIESGRDAMISVGVAVIGEQPAANPAAA